MNLLLLMLPCSSYSHRHWDTWRSHEIPSRTSLKHSETEALVQDHQISGAETWNPETDEWLWGLRVRRCTKIIGICKLRNELVMSKSTLFNTQHLQKLRFLVNKRLQVLHSFLIPHDSAWFITAAALDGSLFEDAELRVEVPAGGQGKQTSVIAVASCCILLLCQHELFCKFVIWCYFTDVTAIGESVEMDVRRHWLLIVSNFCSQNQWKSATTCHNNSEHHLTLTFLDP